MENIWASVCYSLTLNALCTLSFAACFKKLELRYKVYNYYLDALPSTIVMGETYVKREHHWTYRPLELRKILPVYGSGTHRFLHLSLAEEPARLAEFLCYIATTPK